MAEKSKQKTDWVAIQCAGSRSNNIQYWDTPCRHFEPEGFTRDDGISITNVCKLLRTGDSEAFWNEGRCNPCEMILIEIRKQYEKLEKDFPRWIHTRIHTDPKKLKPQEDEDEAQEPDVLKLMEMGIIEQDEEAEPGSDPAQWIHDKYVKSIESVTGPKRGEHRESPIDVDLINFESLSRMVWRLKQRFGELSSVPALPAVLKTIRTSVAREIKGSVLPRRECGNCPHLTEPDHICMLKEFRLDEKHWSGKQEEIRPNPNYGKKMRLDHNANNCEGFLNLGAPVGIEDADYLDQAEDWSNEENLIAKSSIARIDDLLQEWVDAAKSRREMMERQFSYTAITALYNVLDKYRGFTIFEAKRAMVNAKQFDSIEKINEAIESAEKFLSERLPEHRVPKLTIRKKKNKGDPLISSISADWTGFDGPVWIKVYDELSGFLVSNRYEGPWRGKRDITVEEAWNPEHQFRLLIESKANKYIKAESFFEIKITVRPEEQDLVQK